MVIKEEIGNFIPLMRKKVGFFCFACATPHHNLLSGVRNERRAAADGTRLFCVYVLLGSPTVRGHQPPPWSPRFCTRISHLPSEQQDSSGSCHVLIGPQLRAKQRKEEQRREKGKSAAETDGVTLGWEGRRWRRCGVVHKTQMCI